MVQKTRKTYAKDFKDEAVRQVLDGEQRVSDVAKQLDIGPAILSRWVQEFKQLGSSRFVGSGRQSELEEENRRLKRENLRLLEERNILKKAAKFFALDPK
jgi:transposase